MRPFSLLIKPSGSDCNLDCRYCFYTGRDAAVGRGRQRMDDEILEALIRDYLATGISLGIFAWQGGEPTLMGLDFFRRAVALQEQYAQDGQQISNSLQTNGLLLDEAWCAFLRDTRFLVGISCDGPQALHDTFRLDVAGGGTWQRVMKALTLCQKQHVNVNVLALVHRVTADHAVEILDFFVQAGVTHVQFIPCVEGAGRAAWADYAVTAEQYGRFLCDLFDHWLALGPTRISIRDFDSMLHYCQTGCHTICSFHRSCENYLVIEHQGDVYPCDFYVRSDLKLGRVPQDRLIDLVRGTEKRAFARRKQQLAGLCLGCAYLDICRGGCVKDRDDRRQNVLCAAYKQFFAYAWPRMQQLAARWRAEEEGKKVRR